MYSTSLYVHCMDEVTNPLTPKKHTVLNVTLVFDLRNIFQERNTGIKGGLSVQIDMLRQNKDNGYTKSIQHYIQLLILVSA